ncbi:hypothetical protein B649_08490 [Candidatus Sulfuricurvum sp. RIFRC-1]|uniref:hypothetical protein n=1 Tax=Candidatus Sulfuricurvum sp. RIFRC-1 TaxID=1249480 RepID=UPI0002999E7A|nr:hypothetical protein [Candidatus Sulfuricurvum sp. RIFRC-1]AFV98010.1 hypothetical protein B649_08490 [Candidatus Sulfuricurvum sp. RIFRC-1]
MKLIYLFRSFFFFLFLKKKHYDIIFYYPAHFNRGEGGKNVFFEPLYALCKKNNLCFLILEEPELFQNSSLRNAEAVPFDAILILILILRKLIPLRLFHTFEHREWFIAKILKPLFFRKISFSNYIVLSNSMLGFFRGLNPDAKLYDYQHGLIMSEHLGYVDNDHMTAPWIKLNEANVLVYGKGFQELLKHATADRYYQEHCFVLGQNLTSCLRHNYGKRTILFSLQFADPDPVFNTKIRDIIEGFFKKYQNFFRTNNIKILLKHHPRFQNDIDPSPLFCFDFTELYTGDLQTAMEQCDVHMTFDSTTTFEMASAGIPTLLIKNELMSPEYYVRDYHYPLGTQSDEGMIEVLTQYLNTPAAYHEDSHNVYRWYKSYYEEIDDRLFISLMKETISEED